MTEKTLIIAEKPSVAADLAKVLPGKYKKTKTHFEGDEYIISFAIGHLVAICYPEEIDPKYQKWSLQDLPILPEKFPLKKLPDTKSQLNALQKLIRRKDIGAIVNACDAGREGELIFKNIVRFVWNNSVAQKSFKRLWLQSMTSEAIRKAFQHMRDNEEMVTLEDTALCRSESDWLIGINATRALTGFNSRRGGFFLTPCGRVQTPTLSLLVKREKIRREFKPQKYFNIFSTFTYNDSSYIGKWNDPKFSPDPQKPELKADRLWDENRVREILDKCRKGQAEVSEKSKQSSQTSPQLYDLTSLQREANARFGFSAKNTLNIAQALYERHKVLTYPRTDSRFLPEDYLKTAKDVTVRQRNWKLGKFAEMALEKSYIKKNKKIFNNAKVTDHHAIIPTTQLPQNLSEAEEKIYLMVTQRFLAVFFPPAKFLVTKRISLVKEETFITEGKIMTEPGWKLIYGAEADDTKESILQPIPDDATVICTDIREEEKETKPPPRFSEATLLSAMENSGKLVDDEELAEAMKERGLGTPATRAAIIEKLINEKYVVREAKELVPTGKAIELLALLDAMKIEVLASPEMTGEWEYKLNQIMKGEMTRESFMREIRDLTKHITSQIVNFEESEVRPEAPFSPVNGLRFYSSPIAYHAEDDSMHIRKILGGRVMSDEEIIALIKGETIGPFANFLSKKGKHFSASIKLTNKKVDFIFANATDELDIDEIMQQQPLGKSPIDDTPVYETPAGYMSQSALEGDEKKGLKISKIILSRELSPDTIANLLNTGKTELIKGFISKKKRPFDAYLLLQKNGKISFEFPPRKSGKKNNSN
ncbi:MAG: DNA topoisomerase III [Desulfocapsaceae bacterium]|nr:DNA topoisomerase III [Desulfocapsaceae bacterium]